VLGLGQQLRGAHYMSHTLWTASLCWMAGLLLDLLMQRRRGARADAASAGILPKMNES
jgi:membrane-associated PAP2 superfamily phosphatase